ncbi:uncharacterized protein EI90DRAFT_2911965 [Cantharellus anzutake]|uniref:uncharacterized protein n=1 Tax=Cantharellus anzutake TaxID=1750568 RepID=UPI001904B7E6|nr:uncharacterized protein EI90DRAFT_2911965 [Cantharellus anzutake]KAF8336500.1 hypothetical protein EI90DRAFT_2911965 [Cantharellus anzutake]
MVRLSLVGVVSKVGAMTKTTTVMVTRFVEHPVTRKLVPRSNKYLVHDPEHRCQLEDRVLIRHCAPVSARKHFSLEQIIDSPRSRSKSASPVPGYSQYSQ